MTEETTYDRPVQIAEGIFWLGFRDTKTNFACNPYLVVQGDQAVLIDSGSRTDFAVVMMKILQTGISPQQIVALIYQHYDPDLCGSMPNFVDMCDSPDLKIISDKSNNLFISYYIHRDHYHLLKTIEEDGYRFEFNGRTLEFVLTPYAHSPGSFVTFDPKTQTLFSSDLFGSFSAHWNLFLELEEDCFTCLDYDDCVNAKPYCPVRDILHFHKVVIPCNKALALAMKRIGDMDVNCIAPQHGSIINNKRDAEFLVKKLEKLKDVGIDGIDPLSKTSTQKLG